MLLLAQEQLDIVLPTNLGAALALLAVVIELVSGNEDARGQLLDHGEVITFRGDRTTGETWWTDEYGTAKNGDCTVERIKTVDPTTSALDCYQPLSGFPSTAAWMAAINKLHGTTTESDYLYRVTEVTDESTL
jgi:hypothetical protein